MYLKYKPLGESVEHRVVILILCVLVAGGGVNTPLLRIVRFAKYGRDPKRFRENASGKANTLATTS